MINQYSYYRTVYLSDTDAAGVVYFAKVMIMCHEAYELSLADANISINQFLYNSNCAIPIVNASISFFKPIFCGDKLEIKLNCQQINESEFTIDYQIFSANSSKRELVKANTNHVCINSATRKRIAVPQSMQPWLEKFKPDN